MCKPHNVKHIQQWGSWTRENMLTHDTAACCVCVVISVSHGCRSRCFSWRRFLRAGAKNKLVVNFWHFGERIGMSIVILLFPRVFVDIQVLFDKCFCCDLLTLEQGFIQNHFQLPQCGGSSSGAAAWQGFWRSRIGRILKKLKYSIDLHLFFTFVFADFSHFLFGSSTEAIFLINLH